MNVLMATDSFPPRCGGSGWSTWELARGLRARGHDVSVVQPRPGTTPGLRTREFDAFTIVEFGATAPDVPYVRNYFKNERLTRLLASRLAPLLAERQIDIVHAQHVLSAPPAILAARRQDRPVVCTVRDYWPVCYWADLIVDRESLELCPRCTPAMMTRCVRPRAGRAWPLALPMIPYMRANLARKRTLLAQADAVVAVSRALAADLRARAPETGRTRVEVIPNPVSLEGPRAAAGGPAPLGQPYALYVGKLAPNKGSSFLVEAARRAQLPWPLVVVGDGPQRGRVEADAAGSGLDVRMLGWRPREEALAWIAHATLLVFPSHGPESLSRVLLEAGALGRAVAAMETGGTRDIIEHERTGLLSATPGALAHDVARLVADAPLRARLGAALRAHVETTFESSRVVARVESLYTELLVQRGRRHG